MDNSPNRLHDVFFYGLYMDPKLLRAKGVSARNPRKAQVEGYRLRVGKHATLLREKACVAHGMLYALTHNEIDKLYWSIGLNNYVPEALSVVTENQEQISALCCNLLLPPEEQEEIPQYLARLKYCMAKLGLPVPGDH